MYLQVKDVKKSYGKNTSYIQVLKGVSTGLERGQMCVIQGTSGSGKSTLLNCIGGLDTMDSGSITVDGTEIYGMKPAQLSDYRRDNLGFIFQFYNLVPNLTVRENIQICRYIAEKPLDIDELLETLGLTEHEQSAGSYKQFTLKTKSFPRLFAIRQLVRESRSAVTMIFGMLVAIMVVMLGLDCYVMCSNVRDYTVSDTKYEYQYLYKYPEKTVPEGGEAAYIETLSTDCMGYTLDVTVLGIDGKSKYFDARPEKGKTKAVINSSLVERYGYKVGDRVVFSNSAADADHSFTVTDISEYSVGFTIFMDIGSMRELFGKDEDYFNTVYSDKRLDIDEGRLYSVTTKEDIERSASVFVKLMFSLVVTLIAAGTVVFCVVMYLMLGVMIDSSAMGISLIKIFGYRPKEIRSLYLNGNLFVVAVGAAIAVPLAKKAMDMIFPSFIPNVACAMKLSFPWYLYVIIYFAIILVYTVINSLLIRKIRKISPAEILKTENKYGKELIQLCIRTCPHRVNVRIYRHNFVGGKAKIRRRAVALQGFLTKSPAKFDEKTCMNPYVDRF